MYNRIRTTNQNSPDIIEVHKILSMNHIEFSDIEKDIEKSLRNETDLKKFIIKLLYCNRYYTTKLYSNRYKRYVKGGTSDVVRNTRRSVTDLVLLANFYNKKFAHFTEMIKALFELTTFNIYIQSLICSTIRKRVFFLNSTPREDFPSVSKMHEFVDTVMKVKPSAKYNSFFSQLDELGVVKQTTINHPDLYLIPCHDFYIAFKSKNNNYFRKAQLEHLTDLTNNDLDTKSDPKDKVKTVIGKATSLFKQHI